MRLRLTLLALVAAAIAVPAAVAQDPPPPPEDRPAPTTFPPNAAARIAAEVCARVQVENCLEQATELAEAALEGCSSAPAPAMCVKAAVVRGLRAAASGDEGEADSEDLATAMCTNAKTRFPVRFAEHFESVDACVAALNEALEACPTEAAARGCLQAALRKALAGVEGRREKTQALARTLERALCRTAEQHGRRCGPALRARARAIAARCAKAADPKACVREALKPKAGRKP